MLVKGTSDNRDSQFHPYIVGRLNRVENQGHPFRPVLKIVEIVSEAIS
jgi:hypothetical protein